MVNRMCITVIIWYINNNYYLQTYQPYSSFDERVFENEKMCDECPT